MNIFNGYDLSNLERKCIEELAFLSRCAATEGLVLLKNDNVLPFDKTKKLSIFGRTQIDYLKSGTGSGGLVNTEYSVNIVDGIKDRIEINNDLLGVYKTWLIDNPFDENKGMVKICKFDNIISNEVYFAEAKDGIDIEYNTTGSELAQHFVKVFSDGEYLTSGFAKGTRFHTEHVFIKFSQRKNNFSLEFSSSFTFVNVTALREE